ncbi:hypothetical protein Tco_1516833 [Tanacetum coccineum]
MDINSTGLHYTWNQKPRSGGGVLKKLDRIMGNMEFIDTFPWAYGVFQPYRISDHSPANVNTKGYHMFCVVTKIEALKKPLRKLLHSYGNLHECVNALRIKLDEVQKALDRNPLDTNLRDEEAAYLSAFIDAKLDEERFLKQKSKIEWLEVGDSNYAFFHKSVKSRNQRSRIDSIRDAVNCEVMGSLVAECFVNHYQQFLRTNMECDDLDSDGLFLNCFSAATSLNMVRNVSNEEVKTTMFSIGDDRALGPDGFTKIITNRIINGLKEVVSENQSAFIPSRRINDNILITQELMHNYHRDQGPPRCAFKVDIQKAYDTVDWKFLSNILNMFGYYKKMVKWIMACVSSASFSLCINGDIHGYFNGKRGLRQGYPISPYLFTLVMEALDEFQKSSGLVPSIPKSTVYFCNVPNYIKNEILSIMSFAEGELPIKYLGVPLISLRLLNKDCKVLVEKVSNRIRDWKNKSLSYVGRLQLCRSVLSSMHVYWVAVLVIPIGIIHDIEQLMRDFLWYNGELKRGKAKVAWDIICLPKREGGLGIRSLDTFNIALITTHIWNIVTTRESLWVRWVHMYKLKGRTI